MNTQSLDKIDRARSVAEGLRDITLQMRDILAQGMDTNSTQADRDVLSAQLQTLTAESVSLRDIYSYPSQPFAGSVMMYIQHTDDEFYVNPYQIIVSNFGSATDQTTDWLRVSASIPYAPQGSSASTFSTQYTTVSSDLDWLQAGSLGNPLLTPVGFNRNYQFSDSFARTNSIEIARDHAQKMNDTLEMAINRMVSDDMAAESQRQAQTQLDKQRSLSAMNIANQSAGAYTQLMSDARANVGRLASFYI